jgi:hypothetical protein
MPEEKTTSGRRLGRWVIGAVGTLILGLAGVWLTHFLGPKESIPPATFDPCAEYKPPDEAYIRQITDQAQKDGGGNSDITALIRESIKVGHFLLWVADCGKVQAVYERDIGGIFYRVAAYAIYKDDNGRECRELTINKQISGRWHGSTQIYCRVGGKWTASP